MQCGTLACEAVDFEAVAKEKPDYVRVFVACG